MPASPASLAGRPAAPDHGVYASLDALVRLRFKARGFSFLPRQPVHSILAGRHASRLRGRGLNFEELRAYLPGDDIRTLDWKVSARTREPHVRVYTEERDRPVWLLVDQRISMFFGSDQRMKSVTAAEAAALAAWRVLATGDRVGGVVFGDEHQRIVTPHRSESRVMQLLGEITRMNHALDAHGAPPPNPEALNHALACTSQHARHDCLVVLITDGHGANAETRRQLARLSEHNDVLCVFVHDPLERALGNHGDLVFSDGQHRLNAATGSARLRRAFQQSFDERASRMQRVSRRYAMPWLPVSTVGDVAEQVRELIGRRRAPARR